MSFTDRDRKILIVVIVLAVLAGYWFLLLSPKRGEVAKVDEDIAGQQQQLDAARQQLASAEAARGSFASDYAEIVRLGKAIPATVDVPSLLVQLDRAAKGTDIDFDKITVGTRVPAGGEGQTAGSTPPPQPNGAAAPGGEPAGSAPGQAAEQAGETAADAQTSANARDGSVPVGGGGNGSSGSTPPAASAAPSAPGLDTVPLDFAFEGTFFDLADLFHRLKRFVHVNGERIVVRGRLMTIDGITMTLSEGKLQAAVKATVYLAPKAEGTAAGATPQGPAPQTGQPESASAGSPAPPTAAVQP